MLIIIAPVFFIRTAMIHRPDRLDGAILSSARVLFERRVWNTIWRSCPL
jgi:hypothetical protein